MMELKMKTFSQILFSIYEVSVTPSMNYPESIIKTTYMEL